MGGSISADTKIETRLFIDGDFVEAVDGKTFQLINPATDQLTANVHEAGAEDVDRAVNAAKNVSHLGLN